MEPVIDQVDKSKLNKLLVKYYHIKLLLLCCFCLICVVFGGFFRVLKVLLAVWVILDLLERRCNIERVFLNACV